MILYNIYRDHHSPVAKATILSVDRRKVVGGKELGHEYCEVVVNYIIKRDAILPRGVGNMTTMTQAQGRSIAWPYKHVSFCFYNYIFPLSIICMNTFKSCMYICSWSWILSR